MVLLLTWCSYVRAAVRVVGQVAEKSCRDKSLTAITVDQQASVYLLI